MLQFLDHFLLLFHSAFVLFVMFGWVSPKTRKAHIIFLLVTLVAWLGLGAYVGTIGYCPLTDWHWDIKRALGERNLPSSFVKYVVDKALDTDSNRTIVDVITVAGLVFGIAMAIIVKLRKRKIIS